MFLSEQIQPVIMLFIEKDYSKNILNLIKEKNFHKSI